MDWVQLIDEVKETYEIESDADLALLLDIKAAAISQLRKKNQIGVITKIKILDKVGYGRVSDITKAVLGEGAKERLTRSEQSLVLKRIEKRKKERKYEAE